MRGLKKEQPPISLDEYTDIFLSQQIHHLTIDSLNQIFNLHGFKKIHKQSKKVLIDAMDSLQLMDPSRSTLAEPISSGKSMAAQEILSDLNNLNWQECHVSSVQILNPSIVETGFSIEPKIKKGSNRKIKREINGCGLKARKRKLVPRAIGCDLAEGKWKFVPKKKRTGF